MKKTSNPYGDLQIAIVKQAVDDYEKNVFFGAIGQSRLLKRWFTSDWGQTLCNGHGALIEEKARKQAKELWNYVDEITKNGIYKTNIEITQERNEILNAHARTYGCKNGFYTVRGFQTFRKLIETLRNEEEI